MVGRTVGNYRLIEKLGEGGMGAVYKGVDLMVEREVAIKMLRPEIARQPDIVERFRAEAVALAKLNHPNIATLYSFFREGDEYFMVMEFVMGRTLESVIRDFRPIHIDRAIATTSQVLNAVEHAHGYGILHRDIKPANIMLTASGQVKVTDFGIARVLGTTRMTQEGYICGTVEYLAPERIRGQEGDIRSDLYSMGVVLYEMLSGHLPFERKSAFELMRAHLEETPPSLASLGLSSIPRELEIVIAKTLAKLPEERFGTAGELRLALVNAERQESLEPKWPAVEPAQIVGPSPVAVGAPAIIAETPSSVAPAVPTASLRWKRYAMVSVVLVLIGLIIAFSLSRKQEAVGGTNSAPANVVAQPSTPAVQPQDSGQLGTPSAPLRSEQGADSQNVQPDAPLVQGQVPLPTGDAGKGKVPVKSSTELERRKAALKALEKGETATPPAMKKTEQGGDRRSSSLEVLQK